MENTEAILTSRHAYWRSAELDLFLRGVDEAHVLNKQRTASRTAAGARLRTRIIGSHATRREAPKGLPEFCYNSLWLATLSPKERVALNISKTAIHLPPLKL